MERESKRRSIQARTQGGFEGVRTNTPFWSPSMTRYSSYPRFAAHILLYADSYIWLESNSFQIIHTGYAIVTEYCSCSVIMHTIVYTGANNNVIDMCQETFNSTASMQVSVMYLLAPIVFIVESSLPPPAQ